MRKSVAKTAALLLALLLLAAAGSVFAAAEDVAYGDWIAVDGAAVAAEFWASPAENVNVGYEYRLGTDGESLYFSFRTKDSFETVSQIFRFWFRDNANVAVYTDFVTVAVTDGVFSVLNAKTNTSTTENKAADWAAEDAAKVTIDSKKDGDYTTVALSFPLSILDKADKSVDVWVSYWPTFLEGAVDMTCLHSGPITVGETPAAPYNAWNADGDTTLALASEPTDTSEPVVSSEAPVESTAPATSSEAPASSQTPSTGDAGVAAAILLAAAALAAATAVKKSRA